MTTVAVANEWDNYYKSIPVEGPITARKLLSVMTEDVKFHGPFTFIDEQCGYFPSPNEGSFRNMELNPDQPVVVYDSFGSHGVNNIGTGYESTAEVKVWIDENLESVDAGEYAIGQVLNPEEMP